MKAKTIARVIRKKMNQWLSTITNEELRKKVEDNLLVSGGSITSMLLQEDVNDYDVFLQDQDVLIELASYYFPDLVLDGRKRLEYMNEFFPEWQEWEEGGEDYLAEGFVRLRTLKENQVKLNIAGNGRDVLPENESDRTPFIPAFISQNAISLTDDVQIVLRFSGSPEEIHKTFDFVHATNYFTMKEGLVLNQNALLSTLTKELRYQGSYYPLTSIIRMKKFVLRKWTISAGEMLKIMMQISDLDLNNVEVLEEQLIGVDVAYFGWLISALRKTDGDVTSTSRVSELVDQIFNEEDTVGEVENTK